MYRRNRMVPSNERSTIQAANKPEIDVHCNNQRQTHQDLIDVTRGLLPDEYQEQNAPLFFKLSAVSLL